MELERLDPIANINQILNQASSGTVISRERLDLTAIGDPDDREFVRLIVDTLLAMEPGNTDLVVRMNTDHHIYLVWVQGMRQPINNGHTRVLYDLRHPIPGYQGVGNVQVYPPKGHQPMKFCVEVNPYGPTRVREEQQKRLQNGHRSHRALPSSTVYVDERRPLRRRDRSPSRSVSRSPPPQRKRSLSPRRSTRRRSPSPSSSVSDSSSRSPSPQRSKSLLSALNPFGGSSKSSGSQRGRRNKR